MSTYENRMELWRTAQASIDRASGELHQLHGRLQESATAARLRLLAAYAERSRFEVELGVGSIDDGFVARVQHFDAEEMRKGLRHGHVAIAVCADALPLDLVAGVAAATGIAATLDQLYGQISLVAVESAEDLARLCDDAWFTDPDCVFTFLGSSDGHGFQHTIASSGKYLAGLMLALTAPDGQGIAPGELQAISKALSGELGEQDALVATASGFDIQAASSTRVAELVDRVRELAASSTGEVDAVASSLRPEMLPNRVLARRVKSFADTLKLKLDPIRKSPPGEPTPWGSVSLAVGTAIVRYPVVGDASDDMQAALAIAKATTGAGLDILGDIEFRSFVDGERVRVLRERGLARTARRWLGVHPVLPPEGGGTSRVNVADVIVRGPGIPEPTLDDLIDDEAS